MEMENEGGCRWRKCSGYVYEYELAILWQIRCLLSDLGKIIGG